MCSGERRGATPAGPVRRSRRPTRIIPAWRDAAPRDRTPSAARHTPQMPPSPAEPYVRAHAAPPLERAAWAVAAVVLVAHVAANAWSPYGVHRDEFLYMAMGEHLRLWRMDFPPFIALLSRATRALFGDSLVSLRLGPALAGAALVASAA